MGKLRQNSKGKYEIVIGNHVMEGSQVTLKKPLIVFEPTHSSEPYQGIEELRSNICQARGVIREKLIFKTRPQIVVGALGEEYAHDTESSHSEMRRS